jgi:hypothetical protein
VIGAALIAGRGSERRCCCCFDCAKKRGFLTSNLRWLPAGAEVAGGGAPLFSRSGRTPSSVLDTERVGNVQLLFFSAGVQLAYPGQARSMIAQPDQVQLDRENKAQISFGRAAASQNIPKEIWVSLETPAQKHFSHVRPKVLQILSSVSSPTLYKGSTKDTVHDFYTCFLFGGH